MRTRLIAAMAVALLMILAPAASASGHTGTVYVVHAIPGDNPGPVDVYVNGDLTLENFEPEMITEPLELPAGTYEIEIYPADTDPETTDAAIAGSAELTAGANVSIVAHLAADGTPTLGVFANDVSTLGAGEARVTVRHTAAAPAVDILVGGTPVFEGVVNGQEGVADLPAGTIEAAVALAGTDTVVLGPASVDLAEGVNTIVYAIGSAEEETLDLLVQTIDGLHEAPSGVESGTGGLKAADEALADQLPWVAGLAALTIVGAGVGIRRTAGTRR